MYSSFDVRTVIVHELWIDTQPSWIKNTIIGSWLWYLTPLSTIFQLYYGGKFYWWRKPYYAERKKIQLSLCHNLTSINILRRCLVGWWFFCTPFQIFMYIGQNGCNSICWQYNQLFLQQTLSSLMLSCLGSRWNRWFYFRISRIDQAESCYEWTKYLLWYLHGNNLSKVEVRLYIIVHESSLLTYICVDKDWFIFIVTEMEVYVLVKWKEIVR